MFLLAVAALQMNLPPEPREFRGAWVATVDNIDWPSKKGLAVPALKKEMDAIVSKAGELKLNALIYQVRPAADAMYSSKLEPWAEWITGTQGKGPEKFDPLTYLVDIAHRHAIEVHVWFNPYRAWHFKETSAPASNHITVTHPSWIKKYDNFKWLDPGNPGVADETLDVIEDVVGRYDIDGVHIDDYFYPYPVKGQDFPDDASYATYKSGGGSLDLANWRRHSVDDFVHRMYERVHKKKQWVKVGISPFGIYRPGIPQGIQAGVDQYGGLYADAKKWLNEGWCDYMAPQLYWKISQPHQAYVPLLKWWVSQNKQGRHLWPGNFTSRLIESDWQAKEIVDQIAMTRQIPGSTGNIHFSFVSFTKDARGINEALKSGPYQGEALVPSSPWLGKSAPPTPEISVVGSGSTKTAIISFDKKTLPSIRSYALWRRYGDAWEFSVVPFQTTHFDFAATDRGMGLQEVAIAAVSKTGVLSEYAKWFH